MMAIESLQAGPAIHWDTFHQDNQARVYFDMFLSQWSTALAHSCLPRDINLADPDSFARSNMAHGCMRQ